MDEGINLNVFKVKTCDGEVLEVPNDIVKISSYFENLRETDPEEGEDAYDLSHMNIKSGVFNKILGHLAIHNCDPPGNITSPICPDLSKNLDPKDYEYVKDLEGMENVDKVAEYVKALNELDIEKLRIVYIAILATEYTLEDRTVQMMNDKFKNMMPEKYHHYEEMT